jgi:hypothetical protein
MKVKAGGRVTIWPQSSHEETLTSVLTFNAPAVRLWYGVHDVADARACACRHRCQWGNSNWVAHRVWHTRAGERR